MKRNTRGLSDTTTTTHRPRVLLGNQGRADMLLAEMKDAELLDLVALDLSAAMKEA